MEREPANPTKGAASVALQYGRANTRRRRVVATVLIALAVITASLIGYRSWRAADRLQAYRRVLKPLPTDAPVYDDNPKTVSAIQDRPNYLTVRAGSRLVSHWLPDDPTWPGGLVLLYRHEVEVGAKRRILSVCGDISIEGEDRIISLFARMTDAPSLTNSWSGEVSSAEVGRLDRWLVLRAMDSGSIFGAEPTLDEGEFLLPYVVNNVALRIVGHYADGRVTFEAESTDMTENGKGDAGQVAETLR